MVRKTVEIELVKTAASYRRASSFWLHFLIIHPLQVQHLRPSLNC